MALTKAFAREGAEDTPQFRNRAAQEANGEYLLYVAPGIRFKTPSSFVLMLEHAQRREIGIVGPRILGEKSLVYSAGITLRIQSGVYAHLFNSCPDNGYDYFLNVPRNCLAVSELCQLVSRRAIEKAGGFGEHWESALLANLDFSLRLHKAGYRHLYTPFVTVYNQTPSPETIPTLEVTGFRELWGTEYGLDPYYSPNFSQERADFAL